MSCTAYGLVKSLRKVIDIDLPGMNPVWSVPIMVVITVFSRGSSNLARIFTTELVSEIGLYDSQRRWSLWGLRMRTISTSYIESGSCSVFRAKLYTQSMWGVCIYLNCMYHSMGNPCNPGVLFLAKGLYGLHYFLSC